MASSLIALVALGAGASDGMCLELWLLADVYYRSLNRYQYSSGCLMMLILQRSPNPIPTIEGPGLCSAASCIMMLTALRAAGRWEHVQQCAAVQRPWPVS